ncbi:MAG: hypothetical protein ABW123_14810 [Cystobacter sp.]
MSAFQMKSRNTARSGLALACAMTLLGCGAHSHAVKRADFRTFISEESPAANQARTPSVPEPLRPAEKAFGARYATPAQCEEAARALQPRSRDAAWAALRSCVERTHFTLLGAMLAEAWSEDLRVRPDAARLIARVVASRGGSVAGELSLLHEHRVPIFSLSDAIAQPDTYRGRYLLLRAQVADVRNDEDKPTVWLVEQSVGSVEREVVSPITRRQSTRVRSGSLGGEVGPLGRANVGGQLVTQEQEQTSVSVSRYDNYSDETGREALGRLQGADPFFAPGKDFVVLARFDGLRTTSGGGDEDEEAPQLPVLTIVSYHAPHPLIVY